MPPGTGDAQLTITQRLQLSGALIVSTPQDVALLAARRGARMFAKVQVPILGIMENMSCFKCPHCDEPWYIFGKGGTHKTAVELGMEFLGEIPLEVSIRKGSDHGVPVLISAPYSEASIAYTDVARKIVNKLEKLANEQEQRPDISL